jgi:sec-independent protein translocase protein TatA
MLRADRTGGRRFASSDWRLTMGAISPLHLVLLLVIVLIVFGPGKLPDIGQALGRGIREFRKASGDLEDAIRGNAKPAPPPTETSPAPAASTEASAASAPRVE